MPAGFCSEGAYCPHAHSLSELRVIPAIRAGMLPAHYKTQLCGVWRASGGQACPAGLLCGFAHGAAEQRREAAVAAGLLPQHYKFELCAAHLQGM